MTGSQFLQKYGRRNGGKIYRTVYPTKWDTENDQNG